MKKIIIKIFDFIIKTIEVFEDYHYGYHIDLDKGEKVISYIR